MGEAACHLPKIWRARPNFCTEWQLKVTRKTRKKGQISNKFSIKVIRHCSLILTVFCNVRFRPGWTIGFHSFFQRMTGQRARAKVLLTKDSPSPSGSGGK